MIILKLSLVTLMVQICYSDFVQVIHPFNPSLAPLVPICRFPQHQPMPLPLQPISESSTDVKSPSDNLKFILPFLDMEIECDRNLHVMQELHRQQIYILHGSELYQMFINRQEKRLSLLANLEGSVRHVEPLGAKIIYWHGNLLLVVALGEYLEVYQLDENILLRRAEIVRDPATAHEPAPIFEPIQQLTLTGIFQELFLFTPHKDRVMIVAAVNFTKLYGKLRIFEWFSSYFEPIEEITVPAIQVVNVIGTQIKYLITGRIIKHQTKTILTVYEISPTSLNLVVKQTLTVGSRVVHIFTYLNRNMIVACSSKQQKCSSFRQMPDGQFSAYRHRTSNEFSFDLMSSSSRFVSATRQNQVIVFTNHRLDCYSSFMSDQIDITNIMAYHNAYKEDYVLLIYKRPFKTLMRIVELEININDLSSDKQTEPEDIPASTRHQHRFESTVGQLRRILLQRKMEMDVFRKVSHILRPTLKDRIVLHKGNVGIIRVIGESLRSPIQIIQKIENLRQTYLPQRSRRGSGNQGQFNESISVDTINRIQVRRMRVENLIYQGDVIEGFSLNQTNLQQKLLTIKPKVATRFFNISALLLPHNKSNARRQAEADLVFDFMPSSRVDHLKVESINGVSWNTFYDSLFLKNRDKLIHGRLVMQSEIEVKHLMTKIVNGLVVSNLLNLKHPQVVHSDLIISRFSVHDLKANTVNGLVFEEDIVFNGNDTIIETPVTFQHLSISGDLFLSNHTKVKHLDASRNENGFEQFYTNKVIVNGSLILNNLNRLNNNTKIILGDKEFDENLIKEKYLLRHHVQNFSFPVLFDGAKITAPHLESNYLNDYKTEQHLLVDKVNSDAFLTAVFMNAQVQGDVICRDFVSKIAEIKENIIHPGDRVNVTGTKIFEAPLYVDNVEVLNLNQVSVQDLVFKTFLSDNSGTIQFRDSKAFSAIKVKNSSFVEKELQASYLNDLPLENLLNNDYYIDSLCVPHLVETTNMVFHKLNGIPFDEFFAKLDVKDDERLILHKDVIVEGSVEFAESVEVQYINNINWNEYITSLVHINENAFIEGDVIINNDLTITRKFEAPDISGWDLEMILKNVLMKSKPQLITGLYHFDEIFGSNVDVLKVNNVNITDFVDLSKNLTEIEGDVIVEILNVGGHLQGYLNKYENLLLIKEKINKLIAKPWKQIYVLNNASWPTDLEDNVQHQLLKYLYKSAVQSNQDQIITGNVKISNPFIRKMQTSVKFPPNLDIDFIQQDGLLKNSPDRQYIEGERLFLKPLHMETLIVGSQLNTKLLNKVDILCFNQSLYRLSSHAPLQGNLKFLQPLTVMGHLNVTGLINDLNSSLIYQLEANSILPPLELQELYVENELTFKYINDMNMEYFMDNRLTLKGPALEHFGFLTFENLVIEKEALIKVINDIPIDNMVFKHSPYLQTITGHKTIANTLKLAGPAHIMRINDNDLIELYHSSLMKHRNYRFDNLVIEKATFEKGLQVEKNLDYNIQERSSADREDIHVSVNNRENFLKFLKEFKKNLTQANKNILYLDYDLNTSIKWLDHREINANQTILHEMSRISYCEKNYLKISFEHPNNIYLKNITSNRLTIISNKFSVKAENYCRLHKRKVKSKIAVSGRQNLLRVFGMKRYIENIYSLDSDSIPDEHFVILHALDLPSLKRNEVRIFRIFTQNNTVDNWQGLTNNVGNQLKLFTFPNLHTLFTNGLIDNHPALTIYHFNYTSHLFKLQQIVDGDYDIMEMIELPKSVDTKQLILSCTKCQRVFIYEFNSASQTPGKYEIYQIITLKSHIDKLETFSLNNERYMLVISQRNAKFYDIYKYSYIQGWLHLTFGYFPNLPLVIPLTTLWDRDDNLLVMNSSDGIPLMLVCNLGDCYLVRAIV